MDTAFAKLDANTYILTAKLLYKENLRKAKATLEATDMSLDEIDKFIQDRIQAANIVMEGYFVSMPD